MKLIKNIRISHIITFLFGAILFGGIGYVVATSIGSDTIEYLTGNNANVENVEDALDDLYDQIIDHPIICYNGVCGRLSYRYWNNNFAGATGANIFDSTHMPATTYATRALLEQSYGTSNFSSRPYYIRSILINGNVVGHQSCIWYNNKEFCLTNNYWSGEINLDSANAGTQTIIKLKRDLQNDLGVTIQDANCTNSSSHVECNVGTNYCSSNSNGSVYTYLNNSIYCGVYSNGSAVCAS